MLDAKGSPQLTASKKMETLVIHHKELIPSNVVIKGTQALDVLTLQAAP